MNNMDFLELCEFTRGCHMFVTCFLGLYQGISPKKDGQTYMEMISGWDDVEHGIPSMYDDLWIKLHQSLEYCDENCPGLIITLQTYRFFRDWNRKLWEKNGLKCDDKNGKP